MKKKWSDFTSCSRPSATSIPGIREKSGDALLRKRALRPWSRISLLFIKTDPPALADLILVLGGDDHGARILKGAALAREGFAPIVVASNGNYDYGRGESSLAIDFAVQRGYPSELFLRTDWSVNSTREEASAAIALMRSRGARSAIIVTSIWHTARARRVYRRAAPDLKFYVVGTEDVAWNNGHWWANRRGRKSMFLEILKTIADYLGI